MSSTLPDYRTTVSRLFALQKSGIKLGLDNIRYLLSRRGDPHTRFLTVHVAGTSGKGSVATIIARILTAAGYRTGLYTSPHFIDFRERITVDGRKISHRAVRTGAARLWSLVNRRQATYFETVTALAFDYFALRHVDIAVIEVGLGGRYDATNVITPAVSVITPVSIDHVEYLGNSLKGIAAEKAGIIKPGIPVITAPQRPTPLRVLNRTARRVSAELIMADRMAGVHRITQGTYRFTSPDGEGYTFSCPLAGPYQEQNLQTALAAVTLLKRQLRGLTVTAVRRALRGFRMPGRLQIVGKQPLTVLDMAHNPAKCRALVSALKNGFTYKRVWWVIGMMHDKDIPAMVRELAVMPSSFIATRPHMERAASAEDIARAVEKTGKKVRSLPDIREAIGMALSVAGPGDIVCITGSVYTVAEAMQAYSWPVF